MAGVLQGLIGVLQEFGGSFARVLQEYLRGILQDFCRTFARSFVGLLRLVWGLAGVMQDFCRTLAGLHDLCGVWREFCRSVTGIFCREFCRALTPCAEFFLFRRTFRNLGLFMQLDLIRFQKPSR